MTQTDLRELADLARRLLDAIESGDLTASPAQIGALVATLSLAEALGVQ